MIEKIVLVAILSLLLQRSEGLPIHELDRRQTRANPDWIVSSRWSDCTASCGGGIQVRSVRCLDTDDVISNGCNLQDMPRPDSFRLCAQVDCATNNSGTFLPPDGSYTPANQPDGISSTVLFTPTGTNTYNVMQNTTEGDLTRTEVTQERSADRIQTSISVRSRENIPISIRQTAEDSNLIVDGSSILNFNNVDTVMIPIGQTFQYSGSTITTPMGSIQGINTLHYYDGFRFYQFDGDKINDLPGPGTITFNAVTGQAVYLPQGTAIQMQVQQQVDRIIAGRETTSPPPVPTNPPPVPTNPPPVPTNPPPVPTNPPPVPTNPPPVPTNPPPVPTNPPPVPTNPPVETTVPIEITDGPDIVVPDDRCPDGQTRSKTRRGKKGRKGRKGRKGKSRYEEEDEDCLPDIDVDGIDVDPADNTALDNTGDSTGRSSSSSSSSSRGRSRSSMNNEVDNAGADDTGAGTTGSRSRGRGRSRSGSRGSNGTASGTNQAAQEETVSTGSRSRSRSRSRGRG